MNGNNRCNGCSKLASGPERRRVALPFAVPIESAEASIVNEHSVLNCLLFFNLAASLRQPRVSFQLCQMPENKSSTPSSSDHRRRTTYLDDETQIAPAPPVVQALEVLQRISRRASRRKNEWEERLGTSRRLRGLHTIDKEQLLRSKRRLIILIEWQATQSTTPPTVRASRTCKIVYTKANDACIFGTAIFVKSLIHTDPCFPLS